VVSRSRTGCLSPSSRACAYAVGRPRGGRDDGIWEQVVERLPTAIAVIDSDGCVVAMNTAFRSRMDGLPLGGRLGADVDEPSLTAAVRTAAASADSTRCRAMSSSGITFECCRIGAAFIALIAAATDLSVC
jgi:hypothetical protein